MKTVQLGAAGEIPIPAEMRTALGVGSGSLVKIDRVGNVLLVLPIGQEDLSECYTPERKAEFLLNSAIDDEDYAGAREAVQAMGLDPDLIPHDRPVTAGCDDLRPLRKVKLSEAVNAIYQAGGSGWDSVEDVAGAIREMR